MLVAFGNRPSAFQDTLPLALSKVFGTPATPTPTPTPNPNPAPTATAAARLAAAIAAAQLAYDEGQAALAKGDFAGYGVAQKKLGAELDKAAAAAKELANPTTGGGAASPSPSASPTPAPTLSGPIVTSPSASSDVTTPAA